MALALASPSVKTHRTLSPRCPRPLPAAPTQAYHVVNGTVAKAGDLKDQERLETLADKTIKVRLGQTRSQHARRAGSAQPCPVRMSSLGTVQTAHPCSIHPAALPRLSSRRARSSCAMPLASMPR